MDNQDSAKKIKAYWALAASILIIGCSAILVSLAQATAEVMVFYRMLVASTVMAIPFWIRTRRLPVQHPRKGIWLAVLGGVFFSANFYFWAVGVKIGGATIPTLLANTTPIWAGLGTTIFFKRRPSFIFLAGLVITVAGSVGFVFKGMGLSSANPLGALYGLLSGMFFAGYFLITERGRQYLDAISYFWITTFCSGISILVIVLINGQPLTGYPVNTWVLFLVMGLVSQVMGFLATTYASGYLPATIISSAMLLQLLVTAGLARIFLGETLTWMEIVAGLVLLTGILIIILSQKDFDMQKTNSNESI